MKKEKTVTSIRLGKEEAAAISNAAKLHHETRNGYMRRILMESIERPLNSNKDVIEILLELSYDMKHMTQDNYPEVIKEINCKGAQICQILSSR